MTRIKRESGKEKENLTNPQILTAKFNGTLRQAIEEIKSNGCIEILRIRPLENKAFLWEYKIK